MGEHDPGTPYFHEPSAQTAPECGNEALADIFALFQSNGTPGVRQPLDFSGKSWRSS